MRAAGGLWIGHVLKLFDALHVDGMKQRNRFCFANSEVSKREGGSDRPPLGRPSRPPHRTDFTHSPIRGMSNRLELKQEQELQQKLSPQQIQYIKLLQLDTFDLERRIEEELEENPLLEEGLEEEEQRDFPRAPPRCAAPSRRYPAAAA